MVISFAGTISIGEKITVVQEVFAAIFNTSSEFKCDGSQFEHLFKDGECYMVGNLKACAMHTPGHFPPAEANNKVYLKLPINAFTKT